MAVQSSTFARRFGNNGASNGGSGNRMFTGIGQPQADERPKAQLWLNIGYSVENPDKSEGQPETKFISLPVGIPLDTTEHLPTNSSNVLFRQLRQAQNGLLDELIDAGSKLDPGEDIIIGEGGGLQLQIRRVIDEQPAVAQGENAYGGFKLKLID